SAENELAANRALTNFHGWRQGCQLEGHARSVNKGTWHLTWTRSRNGDSFVRHPGSTRKRSPDKGGRQQPGAQTPGPKFEVAPPWKANLLGVGIGSAAVPLPGLASSCVVPRGSRPWLLAAAPFRGCSTSFAEYTRARNCIIPVRISVRRESEFPGY